MKKLLFTILIIISAQLAWSQKKDSVMSVLIVMDTTTYKQFVQLLDANIDSKSVSQSIFALLQRSAQMVNLPADKPKQQKKP